VIEAENLTKYYGNHLALDSLSFTVTPGEIVGFLGPNGAGKTTTMRILAGFMSPSSGRARIAGYDVVEQSLEARKSIGYLPETVPLYDDMTVRSYLVFWADLRELGKGEKRDRVNEVIELFQLARYEHTLIKKLSKGYRQRVGMAQAILHNPRVLILDEPTIGIDPRQVVETRQRIKDLGGNHTIILSSHILPEVSMICERVIIIDRGRLVTTDSTENLSATFRGSQIVELEVKGPQDQILRILARVKGVRQVTLSRTGPALRYQVECPLDVDLRDTLARAIVEKGWSLLEMKTSRASLEDVFLRLTKEETG